MQKFKLNDTSKVVLFYLVDEHDHTTEATGMIPTISVSKNGGAFAVAAGTFAEIANGIYKLTPAAADVDTLGPVVFRATAVGADPCNVAGIVVAYDPYDANHLGLKAGRVLTNKADYDNTTNVITYYDDDGITPVLVMTPTDDGSKVTRTPG